VPGATAVFTTSGPYVLVEVEGVDGGLELPSEVAGHIFVGE
jgi:DtxR family transcriptional regulator, iron-dependent repressor